MEFRSHLIALDADRDEFVRVPPGQVDVGGLLSLSRDGRSLLVDGGRDRSGQVGMYTFADGQLRWIDRGPQGVDCAAGLSP